MSPTAKVTGSLLAAIALAVGAGYWWSVREIVVRTVPVQHDVEIRVFGIGTVEAQIVSKVGFQVSGKLVAIEADQGDMVKAGTLIAKLDDSSQRAKLKKSEVAQRQAAANLAKVDAQRERASATYQQKKSVNLRRQSLVTRGSVSQETAEDAQTNEDIARDDLRVADADALIAAVQQDDAAAQVRVDTVTVDQHELFAPFDARVISRSKELGSIANAGETVFTLIAPESIWVRVFIDEASAGGLALKQTAFVRLRSESDRAVEGEVVRIDQENDRTTEERRVYVRCRACGPLHQLRYLGEQAEVEIVKQTIPSGRFIPLKSVDAYDGRSGAVWMLMNGRLARQVVQLGERTLDGRVRIVSAIPHGAEVVADERSGLREGRAARAVAP